MIDTADEVKPDVCRGCGFCWSVCHCDDPEEHIAALEAVRVEIESI